MAEQVFERTETKYILTPKQYRGLVQSISSHLKPDEYFDQTNCSIYFDTDKNYLAIHSLESPLYKEKIRVRSYGIPTLDDTIFLEVKKKFAGIGSKRRIPIRLKDFNHYLKHGKMPRTNHFSTAQIQAEINYLFHYYHLAPTLFLAYDRLAYHAKDNPAFRLTFDSNVRSRTTDLYLESGDHGQPYFGHNEIVMEVKATHSYPFWFVRALNRFQIYPAKFSKYGRVMERLAAKSNL